ncbi:MAG TPA: DUF1634 domain-containing protein [Candidatus Limnocylindrales bacterium]
MSRPDPVSRQQAAREFERVIGRLLIVLTYVSVALLVIGVLLMVATGVSPLDGGPGFDPTELVAQVLALSPVGFLWLGLIAVIATPISRVVGAAIGFGRAGDRLLVAVAVGILIVIAVGVVTALASEV